MDQGSGIAMSFSVGHSTSDPASLWLRCGLAAVTAIQPLAWKLPCATGAALKKKEKEKVVEEVAHMWPQR